MLERRDSWNGVYVIMLFCELISYNANFCHQAPRQIAVGDRIFLGMQEFDFAQV